MPASPVSVAANIDRFTGFADRYDAVRPRPPAVIADILTLLAGVQQPRLVVDLGSGTGLSTLMWAGRAQEVVGIEPSADMRGQAEARLRAEGRTGANLGVRFVDAVSSQSGLPDAMADIVTASQSLHWMNPGPTFAEVGRILRVGGVFGSYDCDWPPTMNWQAERAYSEFVDAAEALVT